jgi:plasmid stabilization system protein ParE
MRLELQDNFIKKLNRQIAYLAADKPEAAKKFKRDVLLRIKNIPKSPYSYVRSWYIDDDNIRHLIFKGYTIVFRIYPEKALILVFGFFKNESDFQ